MIALNGSNLLNLYTHTQLLYFCIFSDLGHTACPAPSLPSPYPMSIHTGLPAGKMIFFLSFFRICFDIYKFENMHFFKYCQMCILSNIVKHCHQISIDFTSKTFLLSYEVENTGEGIQVGLPKIWYEKYNDVKLLILFCMIYKGRPKRSFFL